jgi:hypothetical protein
LLILRRVHVPLERGTTSRQGSYGISDEIVRRELGCFHPPSPRQSFALPSADTAPLGMQHYASTHTTHNAWRQHSILLLEVSCQKHGGNSGHYSSSRILLRDSKGSTSAVAGVTAGDPTPPLCRGTVGRTQGHTRKISKSTDVTGTLPTMHMRPMIRGRGKHHTCGTRGALDNGQLEERNHPIKASASGAHLASQTPAE